MTMLEPERTSAIFADAWELYADAVDLLGLGKTRLAAEVCLGSHETRHRCANSGPHRAGADEFPTNFQGVEGSSQSRPGPSTLPITIQ